jgi:hypothetical protein
MATTTPHAQSATAQDKLRQWTVLLGSLAAIAGAAIGSGAFGGTPIAQAADGALNAEATLLAPATTAFSIWSVIYVGLLVFAVYQLLPRHATDARLRATAWWVLASMILNAVWIGVVQAGALWLSVLVIAVLAAVLGVVASRLTASPPTTWAERLTTDVPLGLYLGWVVVATLANVTATIADGIDGFDAGDGTWIAVAVLAVAAVISVVLARTLRGSAPLSIATGVAMAWGLWWIALGRLTGTPEDVLVGWAAGLAAVIAFATPFALRDMSYIGKRDPLAPQ